jgi:pilus assembly protein CpaE
VAGVNFLSRTGRRQDGQASVELVAVLPFVILAGAIAWQLALTGHAAWMSANAARVAARAHAVGRDSGAAARSALPGYLRRGLRVHELRGGGVRVRVRVPLLLPRWGAPIGVGATSSLGRRRP